jgi:hypothetical protein
MLKCTGEARAFAHATRSVSTCQAELLQQMLHGNRDTVFGREHGFSSIDSVAAYQRQVPLACYQDIAESVQRIARGEARVLSAEPVELLEPTSGTTQAEKLIPYTAELRAQFQRAVAVWLHDLLRQRPALRGGRAYWSISPVLGPARQTPASIPIGFDDDAAYLGTIERWALELLLIRPPAAVRLADLQTFRYATLLSLLRARDLVLISIWNPTFLTALLQPLPSWQDRLCFDLRHGTFSPPADVPTRRIAGTTGNRFSRRATELAAIFRTPSSLADKLRLIWPRLALISCWADAAAAHAVPPLQALFPGVEFQPKGLLATEGCVSIPLLDRAAPVLALRSHFFEFLEGAQERCRLAHELDRGGRYRVVLTTAGGLYRYQLQDEVEVIGREHDCPLLRFLGKADRVSDLVGEKLAEPHVRDVLERLFAAQKLTPSFALLAPVAANPARYQLFLEGVAATECAQLEASLQAGLEENPHYRYAVGLGQLAPVEIQVLASGSCSAASIYEARNLARGQRLGAIKATVLDSWCGWADEFRRNGAPG